jgi:hypothetical protein
MLAMYKQKIRRERQYAYGKRENEGMKQKSEERGQLNQVAPHQKGETRKP